MGFPVATAGPGGRFSADVVGAKVGGNGLEIVHVEVGQLSGGKESIDSLRKKFSTNIQTNIEKYFRQEFGFTGAKVNYRKMYVATYWTKPTLNGAAQLGIDVQPLPDFIRNFMIPAIRGWKERSIHKPQTRSEVITVPEGNWLAQLIDYLKAKKLLTC